MAPKKKQVWVKVKSPNITKTGLKFTEKMKVDLRRIQKMAKEWERLTTVKPSGKRRYGGHHFDKSCIICEGRDCTGNGFLARKTKKRHKKK